MRPITCAFTGAAVHPSAVAPFWQPAEAHHAGACVQAWVQKVLPLLSEHLAQRVDSILWQPLLAQEALLCNLLEVALYHQHVCAALSEDALMELCDFCQRKLIALNSEQTCTASGV